MEENMTIGGIKIPRADNARSFLGRREFDGEQASYIDRFGRLPNLDEYPFASVHEGGRAKYDANQVSVRAVGDVESRGQGRLMGAFYTRANIIPNHPEKGAFGVIPLPSINVTSFWVDRNGNIGKP